MLCRHEGDRTVCGKPATKLVYYDLSKSAIQLLFFYCDDHTTKDTEVRFHRYVTDLTEAALIECFLSGHRLPREPQPRRIHGAP